LIVGRALTDRNLALLALRDEIMKTALLSLLVFSLFLCAPARADLANCFVLRGGDSLGRVAVKKLTKTINDAYRTSRDSDVDVITGNR
jgi:hypothetical protein